MYLIIEFLYSKNKRTRCLTMIENATEHESTRMYWAIMKISKESGTLKRRQNMNGENLERNNIYFQHRTPKLYYSIRLTDILSRMVAGRTRFEELVAVILTETDPSQLSES